ncbi:MAG: DUF2341 domain-containing protein, partial [Chitinivibrionales bacterium]|nr:DUF2341 domain-containing protein [Chitinivibrionales bacterium]MBD3397026.1 DUF2341 domain-containing protein [Chitinivibrionales bacterium]
PLLIRLTSSNFNFAQAQGNGQDIRFAKFDETHFPYEIDKWDSAGSSAHIWVRIDTVYGNNTTQFFYLYWGKTDAGDSTNGVGVFSENYAGVWHLHDISDLDDAASGDRDGTNTGTVNVTGIIGDAVDFEGADDISIPSAAFSTLNSQASVSLWQYGDAAIQPQNDVMFRGQDGSGNRILNSHIPWGNSNVYWDAGYSGGYDRIYKGASTSDFEGQWNLWAFTKNTATGSMKIYLNGNEWHSGSGNTRTMSGITSFCIGKTPGGTDSYDGYVDEFRVSTTARSDDWILLCYETQAAGSDIVSFPKTWDGGGADNDWTTAANWVDDAVPTATDNILFDNTSSKSCVLDATATITDITFTSDYTGTFDFGSDTLKVTGAATFATGGVITAGTGALEFTGSSAQSFTPKAGQVFPKVIQNGTGGTTLGDALSADALIITSGTVDLGDGGETHDVASISGAGSLDFGTATIEVTGNVTLNNMAGISAGSGTIDFTGGATQVLTPIDGTTTHPAISHSGSSVLQLSTSKLTCQSFAQSAGTLDFNGRNMETIGNFTITSGTSSSMAGLSGRTITVGGNATFNGLSTNLLNLNPSNAWNIEATGALTARYAYVDSSDASGGSEGEGIQCIEGDGNTNWTFINDNYDDWLYERTIYINTTSSGAGISTHQTGFPLLMRLASSNFDFSQAQSSGQDIRFAKANGDYLKYEIENWDNGASSAAVWVKIDTVYGNNKTQYFTMHWGKADAIDRSDGPGVFEESNSYEGVWHCNDISDLADATAGGHDGTNTGTVNVTGIAGDAVDYEGADFITLPSAAFSGLSSQVTVSLWIFGDAAVQPQADVAFWGPEAGGNRVLNAHIPWSDGTVYWDAGYSGGYDRISKAASISEYEGQWNLWTFTKNNTSNSMKIFLNGDEWHSGSGSRTLSGITSFHVGSNAAGTSNYDGYIDEFRVSSAQRSDDWIKLCYETQKSGANVAYSPVVWDGGGGNTNWSTAANWSGDELPTADDFVVFDNTSTKNCALDIDTTVLSISFSSGYTGTFSFGAGNDLRIMSQADFNGGETVDAGSGSCLLFAGTGSQSFVPKAGQTFPGITQSGSGSTVIASAALTAGALTIQAGSLDLGDDGLTHTFDAVTATGGSLDFGTATLRTAGDISLSGLSSVTEGTGALELTGSGTQDFTPAGSNPSVSFAGTGTLRLNAALSCESFSQSSGSLNFNGQDITTSGSFSIINGGASTISGLNGRTMDIGGNASFTGTASDLLNLDAGGWTIDADGTLTANWCTIENSDASGGTEGEAYNCDSLTGGNSNWVFIDEDYENDWANTKRLYINTTATGADVAGDVSNFPLLIRLATDNFDFSEAQGDGRDIRFATSAGSSMRYEVESWDSAGAAAALWLLAPAIQGNNQTQYFNMYWGNSSAIDRSKPEAVFSLQNDFEGVWHLHDIASLDDATSSGNDGTNTGTVNVTGLIGNAIDYEGADYVTIPAAAFSDVNTKITASLWIYGDASVQPQDDVTFRGSDGSGNRVINIHTPWGNSRVYWDAGNTGGTYDRIDKAASASEYEGQWNMWVFTKNSSTGSMKVFLNGSEWHSGSGTRTMSGIASFYLGSSSGGGSSYDGYIDEFRVSSEVRSDDWIKLSYETQKDDAAVVNLSNAPVVTGLSDAAYVSASQVSADTVYIDYEVEDPDGGTVTVSAQYRSTGGSWFAMTDTAGDIGGGVSASDGSADRRIAWGARAQLGSSIEGWYYIKVTASDGSSEGAAQSESLAVDTRAPVNLANLASTDTTGNSVTLAWDAAADANFHRYDIWYGTNLSHVRDSTGTAAKWDNTADAALATASTEATTVTGLAGNTMYYFKIWAHDDFGNADSAASIGVQTKNVISPSWSVSSLGDISGGAMGEGVIYVGCGGSSRLLQCRDASDGSSKWSYSTSSYGDCRAPTCYYDASVAKTIVIFTAGNRVIGRRDNGTSST